MSPHPSKWNIRYPCYYLNWLFSSVLDTILHLVKETLCAWGDGKTTDGCHKLHPVISSILTGESFRTIPSEKNVWSNFSAGRKLVQHGVNIASFLCNPISMDGRQRQFISFSAVQIFLSITAFISNFLILFALHLKSSLHPPTKLVYRYVATTDLWEKRQKVVCSRNFLLFLYFALVFVRYEREVKEPQNVTNYTVELKYFK